jgi:hypothetical protein
MDLANRDEIVKRIRAMTGQRDPDSEELTPEDQARMQAQAEQADFQRQHMTAELRKLLAEAAKAEAAARQSDATAVRQIIHAQGGPKRGAIDVAASAVEAPGLMPIADHILHEAGLISRSEQEEVAAAQIQKMAAAQQQAAAANQQPPEPSDTTGIPGEP